MVTRFGNEECVALKGGTKRHCGCGKFWILNILLVTQIYTCAFHKYVISDIYVYIYTHDEYCYNVQYAMTEYYSTLKKK